MPLRETRPGQVHLCNSCREERLKSTQWEQQQGMKPLSTTHTVSLVPQMVPQKRRLDGPHLVSYHPTQPQPPSPPPLAPLAAPPFASTSTLTLPLPTLIPPFPPASPLPPSPVSILGEYTGFLDAVAAHIHPDLRHILHQRDEPVSESYILPPRRTLWTPISEDERRKRLAMPHYSSRGEILAVTEEDLAWSPPSSVPPVPLVQEAIEARKVATPSVQATSGTDTLCAARESSMLGSNRRISINTSAEGVVSRLSLERTRPTERALG